MAPPFVLATPTESVEQLAHVIQTALTPVFLLSGIGTLLNLFNTRLARVSDHLENANDLLIADGDEAGRNLLRRHIKRLHRRILALDVSIVLGALGGAATCGAASMLFLGSLRDNATGSWLAILFALALFCTVLSIAAFVADSLFAWHGLHSEGPLPRKSGESG